jgi:DNA replication protein DnaC
MLEMGFQGMLPALEGVLERVQKGELHVTEGIDLLLEHEWRFRQERATATRKSRSKIRKGAALEEFDLSFSRGLTKADLRFLSKLEWCEHGKSLILVGPTGIGKSSASLRCAFGDYPAILIGGADALVRRFA